MDAYLWAKSKVLLLETKYRHNNIFHNPQYYGLKIQESYIHLDQNLSLSFYYYALLIFQYWDFYWNLQALTS